MTSKFSNKLLSLTQDAKILVLGTIENELKISLEHYFFQTEYLLITEETNELYNTNLFQNYDIVVFIFNEKNFDIFKNMIQVFPHNAMLLFEENLFFKIAPYINTLRSLATLPISQELFFDKIYSFLATDAVENLLKSKETVSKRYKNDQSNTNINEFLDKYNGSIMFLNDDLHEEVIRLKELEISQELFSSISSTLLKLNYILEHNTNLSHLCFLIHHLSEFLKSIDLEAITPQNFYAFDYLTTIIEDITIYLDELFVYKLFKDAKVFEDSLENNIHYFENSLIPVEEKEIDNLEFF